MLRSTQSPITCGFLTLETGRAFLLHPFQSFCVLSSCYQRQQWLTFNRVKPWHAAQPISSEVVLAWNSSVEGETLGLMTAEYLSNLSFVPFPGTPPACAQPGSHGCPLPSAVCLCYGLVTVPWGSTAGTKAWAPYLCSLCAFMTQSQDLDIPPDIWSSLEYVLISWNAIKYTQDESRAAELCTEQNLGGRRGLHSSYVTHLYEAAGSVSDEVCASAN